VDGTDGAMRRIGLGLGGLAVALAGTFLTPTVTSGQEVLQAKISPARVTPDGAPLLESIDVCNRGASSPQINVVVTAPDGEVVIDQYHLVGTTEPGVTVDGEGNWLVRLVLRDDEGMPTGEPYPMLGTYDVHVDCVTTYTPQVRIPYNDLSFEVADSTSNPTTPTTETPTPTTPGEPAPAPAPAAPPAVAVPGSPAFVG
jgi:hypothetical protein